MTSEGEWTTVGIDLGTTYSSIAWVDPSGHVEVLPNSDGYLSTESVVFFDRDTVLVGREAAKAALLEPDKAAECFKRDMGKATCSRKVCGKDMRPEALSAIILKKLRQDAEHKIGPIHAAVIGVPAYFDDARRKATQDAGKIAGLNVFALVNEPTAAAICYGYGRHSDPTQTRNVLVYDLGGGTFDATLMRVTGDNELLTVATDGDVMLGGKDWDQRLIEYVAGEFKRQTGADPRDDPMSYQELSLRVEESKRTLSKRPAVVVPVAHGGHRLGVPLDRGKLEELTGDLLARTQATVELLVAEGGLTWPQVHTILLVGGSSRMCMVHEMIAQISGKEPDHTLEEDLAVAKGAAIYAAALRLRWSPRTDGYHERIADKLKALKHQSVNSHSLGVAALSRGGGRPMNVILIPKNTGLPFERSRTFALVKANATSISIKILEGEAPFPEACTDIGTCRITGIPRGLPKGSPIDVTFSYSEDGRVHVQAAARAVGRSASVDILRPEGLNDDGVTQQTQALADLQII